MTISEPRLRSLLSQANRNAENGKRAAAVALYEQILAEAPDSAEAWAGIGDVAPTEAEQRDAYQKALALDPANEVAMAGLAVLDGEEPPAADKVTAVAPPSAAKVQPTEPSMPVAKEDIVATTVVTDDSRWHVEPVSDEQAEPFALTCYRHPDRATALRCYNCQRPICISCANKTPVGYICPECLREAEDTFFNNKTTDYLIAALVSFPISLVAGLILTRINLGFFLYIILFLVGGAIGSFIGRITKRAIGNRRGRYLPHLVVLMMILGVLIPALPILLAVLAGNFGALTALIGPGIYLFTACSAAYLQMR